MEDTNTQAAPAEELTQDGICSLLKAYLYKKGHLTTSQANTVGWEAYHDKIFKDFCFHGLGVQPPVLLPHNEAAIPAQLVEDPDWMELLGLEATSADVSTAAAAADLKTAEATTTAPAPSAPSTNQVVEGPNGELKFSMGTGLEQERPKTEVENLAAEVGTRTDHVGDEIVTGEKVTSDMIDDKGKYDALPEDDGPVKTAETPAPAPAPAPKADAGMDGLDGLN